MAYTVTGPTSVLQPTTLNPPAAGQRMACELELGKLLPAASPPLFTPLAAALVAPDGHGMLLIAHLPLVSVHLTACNRSDRSQAVPTTTVPAALPQALRCQ